MPHPAVADAKALLEKKQKSKNATAMMCKRMMRQLDDLEPAVTSIVTQTTTQHEKIDKAEDMFKVLLASGYMVMKEKKKPQHFGQKCWKRLWILRFSLACSDKRLKASPFSERKNSF